MAERSVAIRVAVRDVEEARRRLRQLGDEGEAALNEIETGGRRAARALADVDDAALRTGRGGGLRVMKGGLQQVAFQAQDIAVQLQAGTAASIVFAQQGSQILSAFGPVGAVLGLVAAGAGFLASAYFTSADAADILGESQDDLERLLKDTNKQIRDQVAAIAELEGSARGFAELAVGERLEAANAELEAQRDRLRATLSEVREAFLGPGPEEIRPGTLDVLTATRTAELGGNAQRAAVEVAKLLEQIDDPAMQAFAAELTAAGVAAEAAQKEVEELTGAVGDLARNADLTDVNALIREFEQGQKDAAQASKEAARAAEQAARAREREQDAALRKQNQLLDALNREAQALDREAERRKQAADREIEQAAAEQRRQIEREAAETERLLAQPFENFLRSFQSATTDVFEQIFSGGVTTFEDMFEVAKRLAIRFAAEMASLAVFSPQAVLGLAGATGSAPGGAFGGFGGFGNALNQFGGQLGFSVPAASGVGPPTAGFLGTTASFSSVLGAAGAGAVGGGLVGGMFGGQGALGGSIGGAGGAAAGALIGSAIPGVGTAIGALIGGLIGTAAGGGIGSLFGGSERNTGVISGGLGNVSAQGSGDLDAVAAVVAGVDEAITDLLNVRQRQIVDQALRGTQIRTDFNSFDQNVGNFVAGERVRDIARALGFDASGIAPGSSTADQAVQNLATALEVQRAIEDITGSVSAFDRQVEDATLRFEDLEDKARRFGISIEGLAEAQEDAIDDLRKAQDARLAALSEPFEQLLDPLRDFREALGFSGLNPQQQFDLAQEEFRRIAEEAAAGSTEAIEQLAGAGQIFIQAADVFGASPAAAAARDEVLARLDATIGRVEDARDEANRDIVAEIQRHRIEEIDTLRELVDLTRELINEVKRTGRASI